MRFEWFSLYGRSILLFLAFLAFANVASAQCVVDQLHKLIADDGAAEDLFGSSGAISGTTAIVGAAWDDDNGFTSGSAYLFNATTGQQIAKLLPDDGAVGDRFGAGTAVAISGTTAIGGAYNDDDNGTDSGSAYLFDTTTGQQLAKLLPDDGAEDDWFGQSVAISGTTAIVGANRDDDNGTDSGSAYLFDTTTGQQLAKLLPNDGAPGDWFGRSVAISGTTAIVGAWEDDDNGDGSGSAYLFDTTTGQQIAKLLPADGATEDRFGYSVAINGTTAIVGADRDDDNGTSSGSAYLFDATTGQQLAKLLPNDGAPVDHFGSSLGIDGNIAIIAAAGDDDFSGSAYIFDATTAQQLAKFLPDDGASGDTFGRRIAISGATAIVTAEGDDDNGVNSGSAYLFNVCCSDTVSADQFNIFRGIHVGGDLSDTFDSDDSYLKFNPGLTLNSSEAPVWLIFDGTLPCDDPASLETVMESNAGTPGLTHTLEAWNWTLVDYDVVDVSAASFNNDVVVTVDLSSGISDYAQPGTGAVRTRVGWRKTGPTINYPWEVRLDQMVWIVE